MKKNMQKNHNATLASYATGFIFSLVLTIEAYLMVVNHVFAGSVLIGTIAAMAILQFLIQLFFFLHLDNEPKPRLNLQVLLFALLVLLIVVFGSLWIMSHLDYHSMTPEETTKYIEDEEAIYR